MSRADEPTAGDTLAENEAPRPSARELPTFRKVEERFELGDELGRGGMGRVVGARDVTLRRHVAIKQVLSTSEHDLIRFEREVRITAELEHPSIVPIHDAGVDPQGRPFYVMRKIRGRPLSERLASLPDMGARLALLPNLLAAVDAAAFAHARRILHRDIKPSNILLGDYGETLLIDWGIARRFDEVDDNLPIIPDAAASLPGAELTRTGHVYGTTGYMAPEQARGEHVDARADVFALGATLFHVLHGRGPFDGQSAAERISAAALDEPPPLEKLPADTPPELRAIVTKAMASDAGVRYRDASGLAGDLRAFLEGRLVTAHVYTRRERVRRFVRRNRTAVAIGVLAVIAIAIGSIVAVSRVVAQKNAAEVARADAEAQLISAQLERASTLAEIEPVRAVALIRRILERDLAKPEQKRARDIVAKAAARGIGHGTNPAPVWIRDVSVSPDGSVIASGDQKGRIVLFDTLTARPSVVRESGPQVQQIEWVERGARIAVATSAGLTLFDHEGRETQIVTGSVDQLTITPAGDRARYLDPTEARLLEVSLADPEPKILAHGVEHYVIEGTRLLVSGLSGIRLVDGDREIKLSPTRASSGFGLALSFDGNRAAAAIADHVVEWNTVDGRELRKLPLKFAYRVLYSASRLYAATLNSAFVEVAPTFINAIAQLDNNIAWVAQGKGGPLILLENGDVMVVDELGARMLSFGIPGAFRIGTHRETGIVAVGSRNGDIRWWDFAQLAPIPFVIPNAAICLFRRDEFWMLQGDRLSKIVLPSRTEMPLAEAPELQGAACLDVVGNYLLILGLGGHGLFDLTTKKMRWLEVDFAKSDHDNDILYLVKGGEIVALDKGSRETWRWTAPAPVRSLATRENWFVVQLADNSVMRVDRTTNEHVILPTTKDAHYLLASDGTLWVAAGREIWRWNNLYVARVATLDRDVRDIVTYDSDPLMLQLDDGSIWKYSVETGPTAMTSRLFGRLLVSAEKQLVMVYDRSLVTLQLESGEHIIRPFPKGARWKASITRDGTKLMIASHGEYFVVYEDRVPLDPSAVRSWIDRATNAYIDRDTNELRWH